MRPVIALLIYLQGAPVLAHPHIFVDTGIEVMFDDAGRATHLRVTWAYDALYSLLVTEDLGMDSDGDAVLTPEEEAALTGFDAKWVPGFEGDLYAWADGVPLSLSGPSEPTATMREGRIVTTHLRAIEGPVAFQTLVMKPYDPTFYTAYDVTMGIDLTGRADCQSALDVPEFTDELVSLKDELAALDMDEDATDVAGADVGAAFATEVRITCGS